LRKKTEAQEDRYAQAKEKASQEPTQEEEVTSSPSPRDRIHPGVPD
jgi:hypothetical protein